MPLKKELAPYRPVMKFVSVKVSCGGCTRVYTVTDDGESQAVIFFSFWQETFPSVLILVGVRIPSICEIALD